MPLPDAESIYDEYRRRRAAGSEEDIDAWCERHPEIEAALRALHSLEADAPSDATLTAPSGVDEAVRALRAAEELPAAARRLEVGEEIGPFRIEGVLGEGGFAVVYRAEQTSPVKRVVALKALKPGLDTAQVLARFDAERQALAVMTHDSIAKVYDAGATADGRPWFVMEYVDGVPATEFCDERRLTLRERLELFVRVCDAVQHAHQRAIIHRDIKPSNVLVVRESDPPTPKIIDFGIAKATGDDDGSPALVTAVGQIVGTPAYMSPEQLAGASAAIDTRTDIYQLGVLLYELVCGRRPFDLDSKGAARGPAGLLELQRAIREDDPPRPSTRLHGSDSPDVLAERRASSTAALARDLRGDLDRIAAKALAKRADDRYATASELAADVSRHLRHEPVLASPPSVSYRLAKFARRHRRRLAAGAVTLVVALLATLLGLAIRARHEEREARARSAHLFGEGEAATREVDAARESLAELQTRLETAREAAEGWYPPWMRKDEISTWRRIGIVRDDLRAAWGRAFLGYLEASAVAPPDSEERRRADRRLGILREDVAATEDVALGAGLVLDRLGAGRAPIPPDTRVTIASDPPGAEVHCFRYVEDPADLRLVPIPWSVADREHAGRSPLIVRWVAPELATRCRSADGAGDSFAPGDRWLEVAGRSVADRAGIAATLEAVGMDGSVRVVVERDGARREIDWIPFPSEASRHPPFTPGRVGSFRFQLGIEFDGYPLVPDEACRIGVTGAAPLEFDLPPGSWLVLLRTPGHVEARVPVVTPREEAVQLVVSLPPRRESLEDFVWIPGGTFAHGGADPEVLQTLPWGETPVEDFWIERLETTLGAYLEYVRAVADEDGSAEARSPEVTAELDGAGLAPRLDVVPSIPLRGTEGARYRYFEHTSGAGWEFAERADERWPLHGVSYHAIAEYAHWRTTTDPDGITYRLPTDLEWEKAARGADRRAFVWGNYLVWSFCHSLNGYHEGRRIPADRGRFPFDESVYGVRDLAGSVEEYTSGRTLPDKSYRSARGGSYWTEDRYRFRTDTRRGLVPNVNFSNVGVRLVAVPREAQ